MVRKTKQKKKSETDSAYFLKIVMYLILGTFWVWIINSDEAVQIPLPIGFIVGMFFAAHDHFKIDRKIEYAILIVGMFIGFWAHSGLYIQI
jgi:hypothetical protein